MGIDAEILIRNVPREIVTDEWLKRTSWRLCESLSADKFWISDGLPPAEYAAAHKAWNAAFNAHRLYPQWKASSDRSNHGCDTARRKIGDQIRADIGDVPKARRLAIEPTFTHYRDDGDPLPGSVYRQDGDDVEAVGNECLLKVSMRTRYYGVGYERGDILAICAVAEWLEENIPGCVVWYGGDSSGVCAEPFTEAKRRELRNHLYSGNGRDYFRHEWMEERIRVRPAACSMCPGGKYCGSQFGTGPSYAAFHCAGCGNSVETCDHGQTWQPHKDI